MFSSQSFTFPIILLGWLGCFLYIDHWSTFSKMEFPIYFGSPLKLHIFLDFSYLKLAFQNFMISLDVGP